MLRRYAGVFGPRLNAELYELALAQRAHFEPSKTTPNRRYPDWRRSTVVYDHLLADAGVQLRRLVTARLPEVLATLGLPAFDVAGIEVQLTSHNDGEYYRWHTDNGMPETASRVVTFVYYFHALPRRFSGGELVIHREGGEPLVIEPQNDSMVFFDSRMRHEVRPVACPSGRFEDGRFTLNGWVRRRVAEGRGAAQRPRSAGEWAASPFGYRLFGAQPAPRSVGPGPSAAGPADAPVAALGRAADPPLQAIPVETLATLTTGRFGQTYRAANRPVLVRGGLAGSQAVAGWTPAVLAVRFGEVPVQITDGREADPDYEASFARTVRTVPLAELVRRIEAGAGNDCYLVARNYFFDQPALRPLRQELQPPPALVNVEDERRGTMKLWLGGAGTFTPLHFDEHDILFGQICGRKRVTLIAPQERGGLYVRRRFYSEVDVEQPDLQRHPAFADVQRLEVVVEPGDLLFLPVGWWHAVRALEPSISVTFSSLRPSYGAALHPPLNRERRAAPAAP